MRVRALLVIACCLTLIVPATPYTFNFTGSPANRDHWASPPKYFVRTATGSNISGSRSVSVVMDSAFQTWAQAPNAAAIATFGGTTLAGLDNNDKQNTICFNCSGDFSKDSSTLAFTSTSTNASGQILDADILFNPAKNFNTDALPSSSVQDLETVALHEVGHFFGMSHSGIVRAVMYPFAPPAERTLGYDDVMIASQLYPNPGAVSTHVVTGTVRLAGAGVFGAHVVAESQTNFEPAGMSAASIRKTPISVLNDAGGNYSMVVPDDTYLVFAEPLDQPVTNGDLSGYASIFGKPAVQTNFTTRWH